MAVLADFRFSGLSTKSLDGGTTAKLTNVSLGSGAGLPPTGGTGGWGLLVPPRGFVVLDETSRIEMPLSGVTGLEMVLKPSAITNQGNLFTGAGSAISVRVLVLPDGRPYLAATAHLVGGDVTLEAPEVPLADIWQTVGVAL